MDRAYASGAAGSAPTPPASPSIGYPTSGNPATATPATKPGEWWYHMITEEIRAVIVAAGLTPDHEDINQLSYAVALLSGGDNAAKLNVSQNWTAQQRPMSGVLVDAPTVAWNADVAGQVVSLTVAGNRTMGAPTNIKQHAMYLLRITQDATGGRVLAWNGAYKFGGGGAPALTTAAGKTDILSFVGGASNTLEFLGARLNAV